jgi:hypothetical protein
MGSIIGLTTYIPGRQLVELCRIVGYRFPHRHLPRPLPLPQCRRRMTGQHRSQWVKYRSYRPPSSRIAANPGESGRGGGFLVVAEGMGSWKASISAGSKE